MTVQVEASALDITDDWDLDVSIIESGPEADRLIRMTDDGCTSTCVSASGRMGSGALCKSCTAAAPFPGANTIYAPLIRMFASAAPAPSKRTIAARASS